MERSIILGISFSTRMIGVAVFKGNHLIDYSVTLNKQQWSLEKLNVFVSVITTQLTHHNIDVITLVSPQKRHQSIEYAAIAEAIGALATTSRIPVVSYAIKDIYFAFASMATGTRASLIRRIVMFYPELEQYELREMQNKHRYYIKLFEAVGSALLHILRVQEKQG